jgi:hypothetical protein
MPTPGLELLLDALACEGTVFILGAGASAPHIPTLGQLPDRLAPLAKELSSFSAGPIPDSPLRQLIGPLIATARFATTLEDYLPGAMTSGTIAVLLEDIIAQAHWQRLPQYDAFSLFPVSGAVISFNWDGLAKARCPQRLVIHPHGGLARRRIIPGALDEALDYSQWDDLDDSRHWILPGLVMPGEEEGQALAEVRERVLATWIAAPAVVVIGYSFGLGYDLDYDRVWLDTFAEAMSRNRAAPIYIIAPDAARIRGEIVERIKREVNVHDWPYRWDLLARALLGVAHSQRVGMAGQLRRHTDQILSAYNDLARPR